jgi:hypothetical protein
MAEEPANPRKRERYAWGKYYGEVKKRLQLNKQIQTITKNPLPEHVVDKFMDMAAELKKECNCTICLEDATPIDYSMTFCGHVFHKDCLETWKKKDPSCPVCRKALTTYLFSCIFTYFL